MILFIYKGNNTLSTILSMIFWVMCVLFALILPCICPTFFSWMCCPSTARGLLVPLGFTFLLSWWIEIFGAPYTVQVSHSLINATVPSMWASLMQRCLLLYSEVSANFLEQFCISQNSSSIAWQVRLPRTILHFLIPRSLIAFSMRIVSGPSLWSKIWLF